MNDKNIYISDQDNFSKLYGKIKTHEKFKKYSS